MIRFFQHHVQRLFKAFLYSCEGIWAALKTEPAFVIEVSASIILIPLTFWLPISALNQVVLIGSLLLVLIIELINSGIEAVVDRISHDIHPLSKKAKDVGSAAVLISVLNVLLVWFLLVLKPWLSNGLFLPI